MIVVARVTQIGERAGLGVGGVGALDAALRQLIEVGAPPADAEDQRHNEADDDGEKGEDEEDEDGVDGGEVAITDGRPLGVVVAAGLLIAQQRLGELAVDEIFVDHLIEDADGAVGRVAAVGARLPLQRVLDPPETAAHQLVIVVV